MSIEPSQQSCIWRDQTRVLNSDFFHCSMKVNSETLFHGVRSFGHLVQANESLTANQFAARIERHFCASEPRTAAVLRSLRLCN